MTDIRIPEGREELRQLAGAHGSPDDMVWLLPALDGLDIAQKAMMAAYVLRSLPRLRYAVRVGVYVHWELAASNMRKRTLAEWDNWQKGKPSD